MTDLIKRPAWHKEAKCRGKGTRDYFLKRGETAKLWTIRKSLCESCPVRWDCLESAIYHGDTYGIWGGLGEPERDQVRQALELPLEGARFTPELREKMIEIVTRWDTRPFLAAPKPEDDEELAA